MRPNLVSHAFGTGNVEINLLWKRHQARPRYRLVVNDRLANDQKIGFLFRSCFPADRAFEYTRRRHQFRMPLTELENLAKLVERHNLASSHPQPVILMSRLELASDLAELVVFL